ncbi:MAG TPA: arylsulfatase [Planctomycetaceae bacterium]|nr:arylsulfatase [Planctomycetaceae bacterium]
MLRLTILLLASFGPTLAVSAAEKPNIIFILVDDMGYGDPGCFNPNSKIRTPNIDALAENGLRLTDAHAPGPLCHMSRYGLMTGRYPFRVNVSRWPKQPLIHEGETTLPSLLKEAGYRTAMVGKWHLGFEESGYDNPLPGGPVDRGFDSYFGIRASTDIPPYFYIRDSHAVQPPSGRIEANRSEGWSPIQGKFWRSGGIAPNLKLDEVLPRFTDEAISVIKSHDGASEPLFLYLAYPAPHTPWLPSERFDGKSQAGLYGDFAEMTDAEIGRVLAALKSAGLEENSLVVFTSDNGPVWYDRDVERFGHDSCGPLRGMKADAWEAGHRMPMIVRWPGVTPAGSVSGQLVSFTDMLATVAEITGRELAPGEAPDSFSFAQILTGRSKATARKSLVIAAGKGIRMVRSGDWKFIDGPGSGGFSERMDTPGKQKQKKALPAQLYDLSQDIGESHNLYGEQPERSKRMADLLKQISDAPAHRNLPH